MAAWLSDLSTLHELTERLARTDTLGGALDELLRAGAFLVGARRGLVTLEPPDGLGPDITVGLGLGPADLGHLETVPRRATPVGRLLDGAAGRVPSSGPPSGAPSGPVVGAPPGTATGAPPGPALGSPPGPVAGAPPGAAGGAPPGTAAGSPEGPSTGPPAAVPCELSQPDLASEPGLDPRLRQVAARLGYAASYAVPLIAAPLITEAPRSDGPPHPEGAPAETTGTRPTPPPGPTPSPGSTPPPGRTPPAAPAEEGKTGAAAGSPLPGPHRHADRTPWPAERPASPAASLPSRPLGAHPPGSRPLGAAVWFYDEPAEPSERGRRLLGMYRAYATEHVTRLIELDRRRRAEETLRAELLPARLPRVPGVRLAVRHAAGPHGGGDWYDALPLPDGALSLSVGSVTGSGPSAVGAMGRLRAALRAYAVMEGEDPVAVLSDLELLLRLTEPARSATALFAFAEPPVADPLGGPPNHRIVLAGAGHCPPLLVGEHRTEFMETTLSAPLGMLSCWEAPSVELEPAPGETLLLYSDGLLHRTGDPVDRAFARLHAAAAGASRTVREDPEALVDHVVRAMLPQGLTDETSPEDVVLLAAHFER
nr:SpoIIE family protein phosphatase [Streptomyces sp. Ru73]